MMKALRSVVAVALLLIAAPAAAQWQTPNHSVPIGRGGGVTGFGSVPSTTSGLPFVANGAGVDPSYRAVPNNGIAAGATDSVKGSLNGTSTSDIGFPNCTAIGTALRWTSGAGPNCGTIVGLTGFDMPINLGLTASAASSALTLTVTQANGSPPTSGNPVVVPFRVATSLTLGNVNLGTISSTVSLVVPNGASLGASNTVPFKIWIFLNYNGGTPALGVAVCSTATAVLPCTSWEDTTKTSTAISGGSTSAGTLYATAGVSNDAVRIVGYCDFANGLTVAGAYTSSCTTLQLVGPGSKKPGDTVQGPIWTNTSSTTTCNSGTFTVATQVTASITPSAKSNLILVRSTNVGVAGGSGSNAVQISRGSSPTLLGQPATSAVVSGGTPQYGLSLEAVDRPQTTSAQAYTTYCKFNGAAGTDQGGTMSLYEIMGFDVRQPANDNLNPGMFSHTG